MLFQMTLFHSFVWLSNIPLCICVCVCMHAKSLFDPMDYSLPGSFVHGILQARILERVAMPSSRESRSRYQTHIFCISCIAGRLLLSHLESPCMYSWYMYTIFYIHSSFDGHLGCLHVLATVNFCAAVNIEYMPMSGLLDHRATLFLLFWVTSILFSIVVILSYSLTSHVGGFPFLHMLFSMLFLDFLRMTILTGVRWYLIVVFNLH